MKIKLFLLSLLTPLLVSFCSATWSNATNEGYTLYGNFDLDYLSYYTLSNRVYFQLSGYGEYCLSFSGFSSSKTSPTNFSLNYNYGFCSNSSDCGVNPASYANISFSKSSSIYATNGLQFGVRNSSSNIAYGTVSNLGDNYFCFVGPFISSGVNFKWFSMPAPLTNYSLEGIQLYYKSFSSSSSNDCSSIQSQLNTCSSALSGVSANLSSCQSDLSSCSNSCDTLVNQCLNDKSILSGNLANCQENNSSLQNYNDSLSSQLNECLSSSGSFGSGANLIQFDIFRKDGNTDYSLPITNNLFLPYGYKGKLNEDRVLTISKNNSLEYAYKFDNTSFQDDVVESYGKVFLFFMSSGLFLIFLYAIRRYFIGLKSFK